MADYTAIQNDSIEPDAPVLSRIGFALRDNPIAIAEGAPGAPRIQQGAMATGSVQTKAIQQTVAGESVRYRNDEETSNNSDVYVNVDEIYLLNPGNTVRFSAEFRTVNDGYLRLLLNGSQVNEWYSSDNVYVSVSIDVSYSQGGRFTIQRRRGSAGAGLVYVRNLRLKTTGANLWPAPSKRGFEYS